MLRILSGIVLTLAAGGALGYLYYRFIGCRVGGCGITSNVWSVVVFGAILGYVLLYPVWEKHVVKKSITHKTTKEKSNESDPTQTR